MNRNDFREWLAGVVFLGSLPLGGGVFATLGYACPSYIVAILAFVFVAGCIGIRVGRWPVLEHLLFFVIATVLGFMLIAFHPSWVAIPGTIATFYWGSWVSSLVDHSA